MKLHKLDAFRLENRSHVRVPSHNLPKNHYEKNMKQILTNTGLVDSLVVTVTCADTVVCCDAVC